MQTKDLLIGFSADYQSLLDLREAAVAEYGNNWQVALNREVEDMSQSQKPKYLYGMKKALSYDRAIVMWTKADAVLKGALPADISSVGKLKMVEEVLPKFGVPGIKLLNDLKDKLGIVDAPAPLPKKKQTKPAPILTKQEILTPDEPVKPIKIKKTVAARIKKEKSAPIKAPPLKIAPTKAPPVKAAPIKAAPVKPAVVKAPTRAKPVNASLATFENLADFIDKSREVMAYLVLLGNYNSVEDYPYYGFILDATNALVEAGASLLPQHPELKEKIKEYKDSLDNEIRTI